MSKLLFSALALSAAGATVSATPGNDWSELDREINALATTSAFSSQGNGIDINVLLRTNATYASDDFGNASDTIGVEQDDVDLAVSGEVGEFGYRINVDGDSGSATLEDAYAWWSFNEHVSATFGQFKVEVFNSNSVDPENQVMIDRSVIGSAFDMWDLGAGAKGAYEEFNWALSIQNGSDGDSNDSFYAFRVEYDLGNGAGDYEGSYGGGDDLNATVGGVFVKDDTTGTADASMFGVDFVGTYNQIGFGVEIASTDDGFGRMVAGDWGAAGAAAGVGLAADATAWSIYGSYMLNSEWEVALRLQDLDSADDTSLISLGANWFQNGHNAKWQANITDISSDTAASEGTLLQIGLVLGATR